jgi:aryl-alcohol dehydrogenase-like predicted oxidoreductase
MMEYRELGRTGWGVSAVSIGTWAMGSSWGAVDDGESMATLHRALDLGVNLFDTADVYGSEHLLGQLRRERTEQFYVATKLGVRLNPDPKAYTYANMTAAVDASLRELGTDTIDLLQLHVPPIEVYNAETFGILDDLAREGKIRHYGVSVERIDQAMKAMEFPNVQSVQIIFNMFRQRPAEEFFGEAKRRRVGVLARVPLASGLLTGKMTRATIFSADDHRNYNREGQSFDRGETFSGVDYDDGLQAVDELRPLVPPGATMAEMALRWILMFDAVACAVAGARRPAQAEDNTRAVNLPPLSDETMAEVRAIYDRHIREQVHHRW